MVSNTILISHDVRVV